MSEDGPAGGVHLVTGEDPVLVGNVVRDLVDDLVGDADRTLAVEELDGRAYKTEDTNDVTPVVDAAQTPPLLADRRVVVARDLHELTAEQLRPLVAYLDDPMPTTSLVLVWGKPRAPKALADAVKAASGTQTSAAVPGGRGKAGWIDEQIEQAGLRLDRGARQALVSRLGEDLSRLGSVLEVLGAAHGTDRTLTEADVTPFLGDAGSVPPWELTDAIAAGDIPTALDKLHRLLAGDRHALQAMGSLHAHYTRLLRLDGADVVDETAAAALLGTKSTFPAKKALAQARRMGSARVARAIELLAEADLDIRGAKALEPDVVLELLVARLTNLSSR